MFSIVASETWRQTSGHVYSVFCIACSRFQAYRLTYIGIAIAASKEFGEPGGFLYRLSVPMLWYIPFWSLGSDVPKIGDAQKRTGRWSRVAIVSISVWANRQLPRLRESSGMALDRPNLYCYLLSVQAHPLLWPLSVDCILWQYDWS